MTVDEIKAREIQNVKRKRVNPTDFMMMTKSKLERYRI